MEHTIDTYLKTLKESSRKYEIFKELHDYLDVDSDHSRDGIYALLSTDKGLNGTFDNMTPFNDNIHEQFNLYLKESAEEGFETYYKNAVELYKMFSMKINLASPYLSFKQDILASVQLNLRVLIMKYFFRIAALKKCPVCHKYTCNEEIFLFADMPNSYCTTCQNYIYNSIPGYDLSVNPFMRAALVCDDKSFILNRHANA